MKKKDKNLSQISWEDSFDHYSYVDTVNINELEKQQENLMFSLITGCCFFLKKDNIDVISILTQPFEEFPILWHLAFGYLSLCLLLCVTCIPFLQ